MTAELGSYFCKNRLQILSRQYRFYLNIGIGDRDSLLIFFTCDMRRY
jgi:hypothetical protein